MSVVIEHASDPVDAARALGPEIWAYREEIEQGRRLPLDLVHDLAAAGLFRLLVPQILGGREVHLLTACRAFAELARVDGSTAWVALIGNSGFFTGFLSEEVGREIYAGDPSVSIGSVFAPSGRAIAVDGGYRVSGRWAFASGIEHSAWMVLACTAYVGDAVQLGGDGRPEIRNVFVPAGSWEVIDTWSVGGLRGTGSHDCALHEVFVSAERTFVMGAPPVQGSLNYCLPVAGLLAVCVASVPLGIARGAIEALVAMASTKTPVGVQSLLCERSVVQVQVAQAEALVRAAWALLTDAVTEACMGASTGQPVPLERAAVLRLAATHATVSAAQAVDLMYHAGGGSALYTRTKLERAFRDVHATTQHAMVGMTWYEAIGRVFLGMDPGRVL